MSSNPDLSHVFADFVANARYEDLPASAIEGAKKSVLDTLGVILAATGVEPAVRGVNDIVREMGGTPQSTLLGFGGKAPALTAAFHNGAMAHCLDFDDHAPEGHHASSSIVPAVLAMAERAGGVSGRELILAVAVGHDLFLRLRRNLGSRQDWHLTTVVGVFAAAAAAAKVMKLDRAQVINTLGIAGHQASGTLEVAYGTGSDLRGMYPGFSARSAVLAALMAEKGITGLQSVFEGKAGVMSVYFQDQYDREKMVKDIGVHYDGGSMLYKPWPSCGASHGFIHSTLELMKEHKLTAGDIDQFRVYVGDFQQKLCEPIEARRRPRTPADAKFSIPYCVAVAATRGAVKVADFFGDALEDPKVGATADKILPVLDASFNWTSALPKGRLEIVTRDGRTFSRIGDNVPGDAECPMTWEYIEQKFHDCAVLAARPVSAGNIRRAQALARQLDTLADATEMLRVLD